MGNLQSNASSSTQTTGKKNDVFLNFRGADTRDGFTNYLYEVLRRKSIETFMDEVGIEKGEEIWPKLAKTISDSLIFVAIFSKEYASSKWCLRELVEIMKSGQTVIPVFYKVTVHDVRHQEGSFKDGFDRLEKEFQQNLEKEQVDSANVEKRKKKFDEEKWNWRQALKAACDLKGWPYENGPELKVIDEIVKDISEKLMRACKLSPCDFEGLFGFEERFKKVMSLLSLDNTDTRIIGIWGMGGIGKTTLADAIFHRISNEFRKCFIQNVRQRLEQCGGLVSVLQQEVLSVVLNDPNVKLYGVTLPQHLKERLCREKVFIVLDDVDDFLKLEELAGGLHQLGSGSRIIITTRNRDILRNCQVNDDYIYEVKRLSDEEAQKLFCKYAFKQVPLTKDLMALSHEILQAINGNPLGLKVAGSSLSTLNKPKGQSALNRLKKNSKILEVLQISYDGLEEEDRLAFLDIACFFVGEHKGYVAKMLDNSWSLEVLSDKSLITISDDKIIEMHDLLQEMGREIVRKEDRNNPGNHSWLWTQEVVLDTLKNGYGTNAIRGIFLNISQMNEECLNSQAFEKLTNLMILKIYDSTCTYTISNRYSSKVLCPDGISYFSYKLKSLNWFRYPLKTLPSNFNPANLIELDMRYSNIEVLWEKSTCAPKLKWIFLESCPCLITVSSHLDAQGLEKIDIKYCDNFHGFTSCGRFPSLTYLHLEICNKLTQISDHLDAPSLEEIYIQDCDNFLGFTSRDRFPSLRYLHLEGCRKLTQISFHLDAQWLEKIYIQGCYSFLGFTSCDRFPSLTNLHLEGCNKLTRISDHLDTPSLEKIDIYACDYFLGFTSRDRFPSLRYLHFYRCDKLTQISFHPDARLLEKIDMKYCNSFPGFTSCGRFPSLTYLCLYSCYKLTQISDHLDAPSLEKIEIHDCYRFIGFTSRDRFPSLRYLDLRGCHQLTQISGHLDAPLLEQIYIEGCDELTQISDHLDASSLEKIEIYDCYRFIGFTSCDRFPSLRYLDLRVCGQLTQISGHLDAPLLKQIYIEGCYKLTHISGHLDAPSLEEIDIRWCGNFLGFTSHDRFPSLTYLHVEGCNKLTQISDHLDAQSLEEIEIRCCDQLTTISDRLDAPSLEQLDIKFYDNLLHFPPPAQHFNKLRKVQLRHCKNLNLIWCQRLQSLPSIIHYPWLISLTVHRCHKPIKISALFYAPLLEVIDVCGCSALLEFSSPVDQVFNNLREVRVTECKNLQSFGKNIHFPSLVSVDLSKCNSLTELADFLDAPLLEMIDLNHCSSLRQFPRPSQHFNNLHRLDLSFCKDLRSFPSDIHFPSLTDLSFSSCINLEMLYVSNTAIHEVPSTIESSICKLKALEWLVLRDCSALKCFPEILDTMGSLKYLFLDGTAIKGLPHSIENLIGLENLSLCKCKNLEMIPTGIYNLKSLRGLYLSGCSALKCFPEILDTMGSLKYLFLDGTAIKGLPHSIENLGGLETLYLRACKILEMIPTGIYNLKSLRVLCLSYCSKLENLPGNLVTDLSNCGEPATTKPPSWRIDGCYVDFANCLKLDKTAVINIIELQINQHRDMTTKGCGTQAVNLKYLYPGSEVPGWFNCQTNGSSINIQMSDHDGVNGHLIGFALCAVIEACRFDFALGRYYNFDIGYGHRCHCKNLSDWKNNLIKFVSVHKTSTEHVALWYSNAPVLQLCGQCTNYSFEFCLPIPQTNYRVKYCGVCPIYEKHNITLPSIADETCGAAFTSIKEHGKIRKFSDEAETSGRSNEDVIEPNPERTCS